MKYKVLITQSGKIDIKNKKKYILDNFKYRAYAEDYSNKIKTVINNLNTFPYGFDTVDFE